MTVLLVGNLLLWAATIPALLFPLFYARARWERTSIGRQTMALSVSLAMILVISTVTAIFHDYPGRTLVRLVVFATIVPVLWWRLGNLISIQRGYARGDRHTFLLSEDHVTEPLAGVEPVDLSEFETLERPTGQPPEDWDQGAHAEMYAAEGVPTAGDEG